MSEILQGTREAIQRAVAELLERVGIDDGSPSMVIPAGEAPTRLPDLSGIFRTS